MTMYSTRYLLKAFFIPLLLALAAVFVLFVLPTSVRAMDDPVPTLNTMDVYESSSRTMNTGNAICTDVSLTSASTCSGTIEHGKTYRFEVELTTITADFVVQTIDFENSIAAGDVLGSIVVGDFDTGCTPDEVDDNTATESIVSGVTARGTFAGTGPQKCTIATTDTLGTVFWIVTIDTDAVDGTADATFLVSNGSFSDQSTVTTFNVAPPAATAIDVSGTLYSDEGSTAITDSGIGINLVIATGTPGVFATTTCAGCSGVWRIEGIDSAQFGVGTPFTAFVDADTARRAVSLTKASSTADGANITGFDLYQNRVIVKHEATSGTSTTNGDLALYDNDDDPDIQFTSVDGGLLSVFQDQELHVWDGDEFAPGGAVTIHGNASSTTDGSLHIDNNATLTAGGAISVAGNWDADAGSTFTSGSNAVTFNASTTAKTITVPATNADFFSIDFNDALGAWTFNSSATTTDNFTITAGAVTGPSSGVLVIGDNYSNSGTFTANGSTVKFNAGDAGNTIDPGSSSFSSLLFDGAGDWTFAANPGTTTNDFIITSGTVTAPSGTLYIGRDFTNNGTFTHNSGTLIFNGSGAQAFGGTMTNASRFNDVEFSGAGIKTFNANASTSVFTIDSGSGAIVAPASLTIAGNYTNNGDFTDGGGANTVHFSGTVTLAGQMTGASDDFNHVEFLAGGVKTFSANASTTNFVVNGGTAGVSGRLITIAGDLTNNSTFATDATSILYFTGTSKTLSGNLTDAGDLQSVEFLNSGSWTFGSNATTTSFNIRSGTVTVSGRLITVDGVFTNNGTLTTDGTSLLYFGGSGNITGTLTGTSQLRDVEILASRTFAANASTTDLTITTGTLTAPSGLLSIAGNYTNNGTFDNNSGTTTFDGTTAQTVSGTLIPPSAFFNVEITNSSATTTFSSAASTTNNFYVVTADAHVAFANGATTTLVNLITNGQANGTEVRLWSDSQGTQWNIHSTSTRSISFTSIKDSDACSAAGNIDATDGTNDDEGNNDCWDFAAPAVLTISSDANQVFEVSQAATINSPITVTDDSSPTITAANDLRIAIATSSVDMRWDTSSTTAGFSGTASGKVSNPVSYEGGGSVLLIPVDTNFASSDTLIISDLLFTSFNTVNAAVSALDIFKDGPTDQTSDADDDKTIAIKGTLALAAHGAGQEANKFDITGNSVTAAELFAFKLTPTSEGASTTNLVFQLSGVSGFVSGDITNATTTIDYGGDGTIDAGDEEVGGTGATSISGSTGTITFSTEFAATTTRNYILKADVSSIDAGDEMTFKLFKDDITSTGTTSSENIDATGSLGGVNHNKPAGGGGGPAGGGGPSGAGEETGGGGGGGEEIGEEPGFLAPTALGATSTWLTPSNAFTSDGAYATSTTADDLQDYRDFSFNVPGGNNVIGIEVKLEASASTAAGSIEVALSWDEGVSTTSVKSTGTLTTTDTVYRLGGTSDDWGHTPWTSSETNNTNFRLRLVAQPSSNTVQVDAIQVKVYHQTTGGGGGGGGGVFKRLQQFLAQLDGLVENLIALVARLP